MSPMSNACSTVLVVDDDPSVLATYRRLLTRSGYCVRTEGDPRKVLEAAGELHGVDLILVDYKMPGIDGLTLLEGLRRAAVRARCILISAFLNEDVRRQAALLGVDRVLDKPVEVGVLREALSELLPLARSARTAALDVPAI